jgi:hypothetical protein
MDYYFLKHCLIRFPLSEIKQEAQLRIYLTIDLIYLLTQIPNTSLI